MSAPARQVSERGPDALAQLAGGVPGRSAERAVLELQRQVGNRAVSRALAPSVQRTPPEGGGGRGTITSGGGGGGTTTSGGGGGGLTTASSPSPVTSAATTSPTTGTASGGGTGTASASAATTTAPTGTGVQFARTSTIAEVAELTDTQANALKATSGQGLTSPLLNILIGPFQANWFKAKDVLALRHWPEGVTPTLTASGMTTLMQGLVEMRVHVYRAVKDATLAALPAAAREAAEARHPATTSASGGTTASASGGEAKTPSASGTATTTGTGATAVMSFNDPAGSDTITSDIDVSTSGNETEVGVGVFNREFRRILGVDFDPGTVFDLNVYGLDFMHAPVDVTTDVNSTTVNVTRTARREGRELGEAASAQRASDQEIWSVVHQLRYMTANERVSYQQQTLARLTGDEQRRQSMIIETAMTRTTQFETAVNRRMEQLRAAFNASIARMPNPPHPSTASATTGTGGHGGDNHYLDEALRTRASNEIYEQKLLEVRALRERLGELDGQITAAGGSSEALEAQYRQVAIELSSKISEGLTYANEVYSTEGATMVVVMAKQGSSAKAKGRLGEKLGKTVQDLNVVLPDRQRLFLQSFNEQTGDALKDTQHFASDPAYCFYRAGKYIDRMCEAAIELVPSISSNEDYRALRNIGNEHLAAKMAPTDKTADARAGVGDDPTKVHSSSNSFFNSKTSDDVATLRERLIRFSALMARGAETQVPESSEAKTDSSAETTSSPSAATTEASAPAQDSVSQAMPSSDTGSGVTGMAEGALNIAKNLLNSIWQAIVDASG